MQPVNEKIIDGVFHTREFGFSPWRPLSAQELTKMVFALRAVQSEPVREEPVKTVYVYQQAPTYQPVFVPTPTSPERQEQVPGDFPPSTIIC